MLADEVVARARSAIGQGCIYKLGAGGYDPASPVPWNKRRECCCSGFSSWCLGVSRQTDNPWYRQYNGGWLETSAMVRDAKSPFGIFDQVEWEQAKPGHLLVYGDMGGRHGHVGIVSAVGVEGPEKAVHCSSGNYKRTKDAIQETGVSAWQINRALVVRCAFVEVVE